MARGQISRGGWLAIALGVIGGLIALANVIVGYQRSGDIAWGKLALAIGVPILIYAMVSGRRNGGPKT
jgi:high-affinity Fe2+/Pb2+ permease